MLKDDAILMFENYWQLIDHLKEKKDDKGLKILTDVIKNSKTLLFGLVEVIDKLSLKEEGELEGELIDFNTEVKNETRNKSLLSKLPFKDVEKSQT